MPRQLPDFLAGFLEYAHNTESPLSYHTWAALFCVSTALGRRVYMRWGHTDVYPNQYIVLIGPSGVRKAEPLKIARTLISPRLETVSESITKEALRRRLKNALKNETVEGSIHMHCSAALIAEEMAVFLGAGDMNFLADLTDWYDCKDKWTYETKNQGIDEIIGVCFNILGSMAPDWIPSAIPAGAIGGGFTSRVIFVVEARKGKTIANPNLHPPDLELQEKLRADLDEIMKLSGEMVFDADALNMYQDWYIREEQRTASGRPAIADPRFAGYVSRRATHIKKIAMSISAARSDSLVITESDLRRALMLMEQVERRMPEVFGSVGHSMYSEQTDKVVKLIKSHKKILRSDIMQLLYRDIDSKTMDVIESTILATKMVRPRRLTSTDDVEYEWLG